MADSLRSVSRSLTLAPDLGKLADARKFVAEAAREAGFDEERIFDVTVASSEATANAIEHAPIKGHVEITIFLYNDRLEIQIEGPGEFQTPERLKERAPRGLGLPLMAKLADHLALYSGPRGGTLVSLTFYRPGAEQEEEEQPLPPSIRELIEENEIISAITDNAPVGLFVVDPDLRYRWSNPTYRAFLDEPFLSSGDLTGLCIADVVRGAEEAGLLAGLEEVSRTGVPRVREEYEFSGERGHPTWWRRNVVPLKGDEPEPPYDVLVVISEETERKRAEEALSQAERKVAELIEDAPAAIYEIDFRTRRFTSVNQAMSRMSGYSREELLGMDPLDLLASDEDRALFQERVESWLRGEPPARNVDYRVRTKDGRTIYVVLDVTFVADEEGGPLGAAVVAQDITERKQAEDALRLSEQKYRSLFDSIDEGFCIIEVIFSHGGRPVDYRFLEVNKAFEGHTGLKDAVGRRIREMVPDQEERWFEIYGRVARTGEPTRFEDPARALGRFYDVNAFRIGDPHENHVAVFFTDITGRKAIEQELINTKEALEEAVAKSENSLEEAERSLEKGTRYLDAFFDHALAPLVLLDRDFNFIRVNEAYAKATGRNIQEFEGHNHFELFPSDARVIFEEAVRTKQPFEVKARAFEFPDHPEWAQTYWDWSLTPLLDGRGEVEALVFALEDVTSRVRRPRHTWFGRVQWLLGSWLNTRRKARWAVPMGAALQILLFFGLGMLDSPSQYLGIPGPAAALIGVVASILAGPVAGAIVALVGGVAFTAFLAEFGRSVIWPTIISSIVLWIIVSLVAGITADWVRRRAVSREALLAQSLSEREALMASLRKSEEIQRHAAEENARLYRQQLEIAETLQGALVHIPSELGPLKLGHLYRSATKTAAIGGDFYDVFEIKGGKIAILIGDVAGHGVEAARVAALTKDVIHAFAHQSRLPQQILRRTNDLLVEKALTGFVTVFLGILDTGSLRLCYASAGHPETLIRRSSGEIQGLGVGSAPLGVSSDASWKMGEIDLEVGDLLLLYTDGIIEARRDADFFGEKRLQALLRRKNISVERLPALILHRVLAFSGGELKDDVAILALTLTGEGACNKPIKGSFTQEKLLG